MTTTKTPTNRTAHPIILAARAEFIKGYLLVLNGAPWPAWDVSSPARKGWNHAYRAQIEGGALSEADAADVADRLFVAPAVGIGATYTVWSDEYACTVIEVRKRGREVVLRRDKAQAAGPATPMGDYADGYTYEPDPDGDIFVVSLREARHGARYVWKTVGMRASEQGGYAVMGERHTYYDRSF